MDLSTKVSKNVSLRIPIVSSPMDTVTEADMAITMATVSGAVPIRGLSCIIKLIRKGACRLACNILLVNAHKLCKKNGDRLAVCLLRHAVK